MTRTGLLFSGQGSQRAGMGGPWQQVEAWAVVERISDVSGHDLVSLLLDADDETLKRTDRAQIATFALEMVVLAHFLIADDDAQTIIAHAGHSLGEYSALVAAGVLDIEGAARLVAARGAAMFAAANEQPGTMVAVMGMEEPVLAAAVAELQGDGARVWVANDNAPGQIVLAGDEDGIARARDLGKVIALPVGGAFHSPLMASAEPALRSALDAAHFGAGTAPVVANVDARPHAGGPEWRDLLARQLTAPVRWTPSVRTLVDDLGCDAFVEIGPGTTLASMVKRIAKGVPCRPVGPPVAV
jgi:[acyl-carrier-protein] S-malonyltransferase